jgi:uncharacterized protein (DUF1501 family)
MQRRISRERFLLGSVGMLGGTVALSQQMAKASGEDGYLLPAKAKRCIFFSMEGGPSQFDLFSYKPKLRELEGMRPPDELISGTRFAFIDRSTTVLHGSPFAFSQHGESGLWFSELLPKLGDQADRLCVLNTVRSSQFNHHPAQLLLHTGHNVPGYPSVGAWVTHALGPDNADLPAFIALNSSRFLTAGEAMYGSGFLSAAHGGVLLNSKGPAVLHLTPPDGVSESNDHQALLLSQALNEMHSADTGDATILARNDVNGLGERMMRSVPELLDFSSESQSTLDRYGIGRADLPTLVDGGRRPDAGCFDTFARHCLQARRLVERGVRFVDVFSGSWDMHNYVDREMPFFAAMVDQPIAALLDDLATRGLLEETLVVIASEFGRTPITQNTGTDQVGRDHHPDAFPIILAGGGVRGGMVYGETDDIGWRATDVSLEIGDFHATLLRLLGIDHEKLTFRHDGLDQRLTPITQKSRVIEEILQ